MAEITDAIAPGGGPGSAEPDMQLELIVAGEHSDPHRVLGLHDGVVRAYRPDALAMRVVPVEPAGTAAIEMTRIHPAGVFEATIGSASEHYHLQADYGNPGWVST